MNYFLIIQRLEIVMRMNVTTKVKRYFFSFSDLKTMPNKLNESQSILDSYAYYIKSTTINVFETILRNSQRLKYTWSLVSNIIHISLKERTWNRSILPYPHFITRGPKWAYIAHPIYTGVMDRNMDWKIWSKSWTPVC